MPKSTKLYSLVILMLHFVKRRLCSEIIIRVTEWTYLTLKFYTVSYIRLDVPTPKPIEENSPRMDGFPGPDPDAGRYPYYHVHEVFDHEDFENGPLLRVPVYRAGYRVLLVLAAHVFGPSVHPGVEEHLFVEQAGYDDDGGDCVQDGENSYPYHEFL